MRLNLIYARSRNGVIGRDGQMPWHLPEDLAHFRRTTLGQPVIMGRKTWDSLPPRFRPLPGRLNIVITRQPDWHPEPASDDVRRASSLPEALALSEVHGGTGGTVWVMGGAQIYALAAPMAHQAVVTEIEADFEGDALAPNLGEDWQEIARERHTAANGLAYSFVTYQHLI